MDEETGYFATWKHLANMLVINVKKRAQRQTKEDWEVEAPELQSARRKNILNGDHEFDDIMHNARRRLELRSEPAMLCKSYPLRGVSNPNKDDLERGEKLLANRWEGTRKRKVSILHDQLMITKKQQLRQKDLAFTKAKAVNTKVIMLTGQISMTHDNLAHKPIPISQAMKFLMRKTQHTNDEKITWATNLERSKSKK